MLTVSRRQGRRIRRSRTPVLPLPPPPPPAFAKAPARQRRRRLVARRGGAREAVRAHPCSQPLPASSAQPAPPSWLSSTALICMHRTKVFLFLFLFCVVPCLCLTSRHVSLPSSTSCVVTVTAFGLGATAAAAAASPTASGAPCGGWGAFGRLSKRGQDGTGGCGACGQEEETKAGQYGAATRRRFGVCRLDSCVEGESLSLLPTLEGNAK